MEAIWSQLLTEQPSDELSGLDLATPLEIVTAMNTADKTVAQAVEAALPQVAAAVDAIVLKLRAGGRLFYVGAGTSGRLGVLDAAECRPTFNTPPELVQAIMAGGPAALLEAVEGAEDSEELAAQDLNKRQVCAADVVVGVTASGRTPYVIAALDYARSVGARTVSITCNQCALISEHADVAIEVPTGAEILMGSTRLKAGTAQKMVLNMISTATMIRLGKSYRNLMVDLNASNGKLRERSLRIIMFATGLSYDRSAEALSRADGSLKRAILMILKDVDQQTADQLLDDAKGSLRAALEGAESAPATVSK